MGSHVFPIPHLMDAAQMLLRVIAFLAPISAAEYAWIVLRRMSAPHPPAPIVEVVPPLGPPYPGEDDAPVESL